MVEKLSEALAELVAAGRADEVGESPFVPLLELESGARIGLDGSGSWLVVNPDGQAWPFAAGSEGHFLEVIEGKRADFDQSVAAAAESLGLPAEAVVQSFPAVALVRTALERRSSYLARLGLLWLLTTELRDLRREIVEISQDKHLPVPVRDLAKRLTVPG